MNVEGLAVFIMSHASWVRVWNTSGSPLYFVLKYLFMSSLRRQTKKKVVKTNFKILFLLFIALLGFLFNIARKTLWIYEGNAHELKYTVQLFLSVNKNTTLKHSQNIYQDYTKLRNPQAGEISNVRCSGNAYL